jgi:hypothetical protein
MAFSEAARISFPSTTARPSSKPATGRLTKISTGPSGGKGYTHVPYRQPDDPPPPPASHTEDGDCRQTVPVLRKVPTSQTIGQTCLTTSRPPIREPNANPRKSHTGPLDACHDLPRVPTGIGLYVKVDDNPFGYTARLSIRTAAPSLWCTMVLTGRSQGTVPSDGRSQAGAAHWWCLGLRSGRGGAGSKKAEVTARPYFGSRVPVAGIGSRCVAGPDLADKMAKACETEAHRPANGRQLASDYSAAPTAFARRPLVDCALSEPT